MGKLNKADVLRQFDDIEATFQKAQIVGGEGARRNVDTEGWAGSSWEELDFPNSVPNGTDWVPKKKPSRRVVKSALEYASNNDLEEILALRKSGVPNPAKAEAEIMNTIPGVEKALCPSCDGNSIYKGGDSFCGTCRNFGFCFITETDDHRDMVKAIQVKYNVHLITQDFLKKSKGKNDGGAADNDSTTTPSGSGAPKVNKNERSKEDRGGKVAKGHEGEEDILDELEGMDDKDEDSMDEKRPPMPPSNEDEDMDEMEAIKGLRRRVNLLAKGVAALLRNQNVILKSNYQTASLLSDVANLSIDTGDGINMVKGVLAALTAPQDSVNKSMGGNRTAARGPKSIGPGNSQLTTISKSWVTDAPGSNLPGTDGAAQGDFQPKYEFGDLQKAAAEMAIQKSSNGKPILDRRTALVIDSGHLPELPVIQQIEKWIDQNGVPQ